MNYTKTRAVQVAIGERRKPEPGGQPGYLRVDTVHQGDRDGIKGVYHINAVDEVTQWQVVGAVTAITQAYLEPVLKAIFKQFPFPIRGFHSDNGSEFINETVSGLLKQLLIGQTKSRPRKSNDNGLVESKNGAVIRKHMGYGYIAAAHAGEIDRFYQRQFNPYLNYHRPCGQPERVTDADGKEKFVYRRYATPWETLRELVTGSDAKATLKPEHSIQSLDRVAREQAIPNRRSACRKQNTSCSALCTRSAKAHETSGALWKWRAVENQGKPKPGFPSVSPGPWKSLRDSHILHSARAEVVSRPKRPTKTKEKRERSRFALA